MTVALTEEPPELNASAYAANDVFGISPLLMYVVVLMPRFTTVPPVDATRRYPCSLDALSTQSHLMALDDSAVAVKEVGPARGGRCGGHSHSHQKPVPVRNCGCCDGKRTACAEIDENVVTADQRTRWQFRVAAVGDDY